MIIIIEGLTKVKLELTPAQVILSAVSYIRQKDSISNILAETNVVYVVETAVI